MKQELMTFEEAASEDLMKSEKNVIGNQRKRNPYYVVLESLATLSPVVREKEKMCVI